MVQGWFLTVCCLSIGVQGDGSGQALKCSLRLISAENEVHINNLDMDSGKMCGWIQVKCCQLLNFSLPARKLWSFGKAYLTFRIWQQKLLHNGVLLVTLKHLCSSFCSQILNKRKTPRTGFVWAVVSLSLSLSLSLFICACVCGQHCADAWVLLHDWVLPATLKNLCSSFR